MNASLPVSHVSSLPQAPHSCNLSRQIACFPLRHRAHSRHLNASKALGRSPSSSWACLKSEDGMSRDAEVNIRAFNSDSESSSRLPTQGESLVRGIGGDDDGRGVQLMERSKPPADIDYLAVSSAALCCCSETERLEWLIPPCMCSS